MCDQSWRFNGKTEFIGAFFIPVVQKTQLGEAIKCNIQFKRIEMLAVKIKPILLCEFFRIEFSFPLLIMKARATDKPFHASRLLDKQIKNRASQALHGSAFVSLSLKNA